MKKINMGITFYGGVSLAVYEAGVAEEFIRFIQFCKNGGSGYLKTGNSDVEMKVISGTSAGGLAAVLMSAALVNSDDPTRHINEMRRIWFDVADLSAIQYKRGQDVRSLLNNDILEEEIENFLKIRVGDKGLCRDMEILITATNMQGFFDAIPIEHDFVKKEEYAERVFPTIRHTEVFTFTGGKIREASDEKGEEIRKRISKAARITSSFPAAFPPQLAQSPSFSDKTIEWYTSERDKETKPLHFWYFDGGVLDNKPLGHAIDHMQSSAADGNWWYFFVEPKPQVYGRQHKEWGTDPLNPPDPAATVMAVFDARGAETIYYDLRRIQAINHQVMQINSLVPELCNLLADCPDLSGDFLRTCEDNVKTSRLHRFLPDYLRCITMIRDAFIRESRLDEEKRIAVEKLSGLALEKIRPLDLAEIIRQAAGNNIVIKKIPSDMRKRINEDDGLKKALNEFDAVAERVRESQLLFRQITFWVECNRKKGDEFSEETWSRFNDARRELEGALSSLVESYDDIEKRIGELMADDALLKTIKSFVLLNEAVHAAAGVETREKINMVKIYHNEKDYGPLAGAKIANFAGFLDRGWRKHDYLMGIRDAREMLRGKLKGIITASDFWKDYDSWRSDVEKTGILERNRLTDDNVLRPEDMALENLAADRVMTQLNGILKSSGKLIAKHDDKIFYTTLKKIRIAWLFSVMRFILWLIKQATVKPEIGYGAPSHAGTNTIRSFVMSGRRYMGFMSIGIILGILISFFLPDALRDTAHWMWIKIKALLIK